MKLVTEIVVGLVIVACAAEVADAGLLGRLFRRSRHAVHRCGGHHSPPRHPKACGSCRNGVCRPAPEKATTEAP